MMMIELWESRKKLNEFCCMPSPSVAAATESLQKIGTAIVKTFTKLQLIIDDLK